MLDEITYNHGVTAIIYDFGLMRRTALLQTRLLGRYMGADLVFLLELALAGAFARIPEPLMLIRAHAGSSTYGEIANAPAQMQAFIDPSVTGFLPLQWSRRRRYLEIFIAIARSHTSGAEKAALFRHTSRVVGRYLLDYAQAERAKRAGRG
jgi:hypothetical protein